MVASIAPPGFATGTAASNASIKSTDMASLLRGAGLDANQWVAGFGVSSEATFGVSDVFAFGASRRSTEATTNSAASGVVADATRVPQGDSVEQSLLPLYS